MNEDIIVKLLEELERLLNVEVERVKYDVAKKLDEILNNLPKQCSSCKVRTKSFMNSEGKYVCFSCFDEAELFSLFFGDEYFKL